MPKTHSYKVMFIYMHIYAMKKLAPFTNTNTQLEEHKQDFAQDYVVYVLCVLYWMVLLGS